MTGPDDLLTTEGVDEGSAQSTEEGATPAGTAPGAVGGPGTGGPAGESDPAPPADMESDASRSARDERGTGQQLSAGEG